MTSEEERVRFPSTDGGADFADAARVRERRSTRPEERGEARMLLEAWPLAGVDAAREILAARTGLPDGLLGDAA